VLAVVKPVGITVDECKDLVVQAHPTWSHVHRLDKLVSGCLVGGLTWAARSKLHRCIVERSCLKVYCALIQHNPGFPRATLINRPLKCKTFGKPVVQVCRTYVETIWENDLIRCVLCYPITGRSQQIRRHLAMNDSQIVSIDSPKQVFLYLHSLLYRFDDVTIRTPTPHWISHITDLDTRVDSFLVSALLARLESETMLN
jgi:hypothetical protein